MSNGGWRAKLNGLARSRFVGWLASLGVVGCLVAMVLGTQGLPPATERLEPAAASGAVGPKLLDDSRPALPVRANTGGATMAFERPNVLTLTKAQAAVRGGKGRDVASASLVRPGRGELSAPLESLVPSSSFGLRVDPFSGRAGEFHWGQDFAAACGSRVYAADAGVVRAVGWHLWGGGNRVEIQHADGLITTYNHLQGIAVVRGEPVRVGQVIAAVGSTGSSTGCHLHFETVVNGAHVDPARFRLLPVRQVDALDEIEMVSYAPGSGSRGEARPGWAIPGSAGAGAGRLVTGGEQEKPWDKAPRHSGTPGAQIPRPAPPGSAGAAKPPTRGVGTVPSAGSPSKPAARPGSTTPGTSPSAPPAPKPAAPAPSAPKPAAPKPTSPTPTAPKPTAPKPTAPAPTAPKPTSPTPTAPKPTAPKPSAPKPTAPSAPAPTAPTPTILDPVTSIVGGVVGGLVGGLLG
ncbi:M23 family metallopeptidase [Arthrobacter sp. SW1]|uniref:M23 family metallopeptidase n=1 Tax=Arthrobacter sp. SW1 TaxID=1920889 RepID=UPI0009F1E0C1|nr:M23 family metallopeptidase [Arthrobacter sp. SW1]